MRFGVLYAISESWVGVTQRFACWTTGFFYIFRAYVRVLSGGVFGDSPSLYFLGMVFYHARCVFGSGVFACEGRGVAGPVVQHVREGDGNGESVFVDWSVGLECSPTYEGDCVAVASVR